MSLFWPLAHGGLIKAKYCMVYQEVDIGRPVGSCLRRLGLVSPSIDLESRCNVGGDSVELQGTGRAAIKVLEIPIDGRCLGLFSYGGFLIRIFRLRMPKWRLVSCVVRIVAILIDDQLSFMDTNVTHLTTESHMDRV